MSQTIVADLSEEGDLRSEAGRDGRAVGPTATNGFVDRRQRGFPIGPEVLARGERGRLDVAVDITNDNQTGGLEDRFVQHVACCTQYRNLQFTIYDLRVDGCPR